ncbi:MAG: RNA-binding domain-containing protein [Actinomycetota bacterium]
MFEAHGPVPRSGFKGEGDLWDYKADCPKPGRTVRDDNAWAALSLDVLSFHNSDGGVIVFGIRDDDFTFSGATSRLDSKLLNDGLRRYLPDTIWVEYQREYIQADQRYLGMAIVPPHGSRLERFITDAPNLSGRELFEAGDSAIREGDSTRRLTRAEADEHVRSLATPIVGQVYVVDEPFYRILAPEYSNFVVRDEPCAKIESALRDQRAAVTSVIGIGGVGKTALATWAALGLFDRGEVDFIVSITAKDRELTLAGIRALAPALTTFETLLDSILDVLGFPELREKPLAEKEQQVREVLQDSNGLLYVDNLETVDDPRTIEFLDSLPLGVRALVTSRRPKVRVSVHPVDLGPLTDTEVLSFVTSLNREPGLGYVSRLSDPERLRIGQACDGIPLAIRWALARAESTGGAIEAAERITESDRHGEELLEFCFRRVFDTLLASERAVLEILSLFERPISAEAIVAGSEQADHRLLDGIDALVSESLVQRLFDSALNDYVYTLLPMTRAFVYGEVQPDLEDRVRRRLSDWFEARDVKDTGERVLIRELRQGKGGSESGLVDLARAAERRGDIHSAEDLYEQALRRNPNSWQAARWFGEFARHVLGNRAQALQLYEQAAASAPARGPDRARIFREWGMLLRDSGIPEATDQAIEKFEIALTEMPNDAVAIHALAVMLERKGAHRRVIDLLEPLRSSSMTVKTRRAALQTLTQAYQGVNDTLKAAEAKRDLDVLREEHPEAFQ